jgi:hypothetical protein
VKSLDCWNGTSPTVYSFYSFCTIQYQLALLFSLFVDTTILPPDVADRKMEFVCEAAAAIQSSLAGTTNHDTGTLLAVRLLLPHATTSPLVRGTLATLLEHYAPSTEQYAKTCLVHVRPLLHAKSLQLLDACTSIVLSLHRRLVAELNFEAAVLVLMEGLELEALVLTTVDKPLGTCYRTLARLCVETADHLLQWALQPSQPQQQQEEGPLSREIAMDLKRVLEQQPQLLSEARLLLHAVPLADALVLRQYDRVCDLIPQLLTEDIDAASGNTQLRNNVHWHVLVAAQTSLDAGSSFDTKGITIVMERFWELTTLPQHSQRTATTSAMEQSLAKGLGRAFVKENAAKRSAAVTYKQKDGVFSGVATSNLHTHSLDVQERYVQQLLDL